MKLTLQSRLLVSFLTLTVLSFLIVAGAAFYIGKTYLEYKIGSHMLNMARGTIDKIDRYFSERTSDVMTWASLGMMDDLITEDQDLKITTFLQTVQRNYRGYLDLYCANTQGKVVASTNLKQVGSFLTPQLLGINQPFDFRRSLQFFERPADFLISISHPIRSSLDQSEIGFLVAIIDWKTIDETLDAENIEDQAQDPLRYILMAQPDGTLLHLPKFIKEKGAGSKPKQHLKELVPETAMRVLKGEEGYLIEKSPGGEKFLISYAREKGYGKYKGLGWVLLVFQNAHEAFSIIGTLAKSILFIAGFTIGIVILVSVILSKGITKPVERVIALMKTMADGHLPQIEELKQVTGPGSLEEMEALGKTFQEMTGYMRQMARVAESISRGNLQEELTPKSDRDVLGCAFKEMEDYLHRMAETARCIARGDLSQMIEPKSPEDVLGMAFKEMSQYLKDMARVSERISKGDLSQEIKPKSDKDVLGLAFQEMTHYLETMAREAVRIARGDLTGQISLRSEKDVLGAAFKKMSRYLKEVSEAVTQVARGDLAQAPQPVSENDILRIAFNQMVHQLVEANKSQHLVQTKLSEVAQYLNTSSGQMTALSQHQVGETTELASAIKQASIRMEELSITTRRIADSAGAVAGVSEEALGISYSGKEVIERGYESMQKIQREVEEIARKMQELGDKSRQIGNILGIINDISEQTKILGLNADIQATMAGEAGRGFAVVAGEVRNLAKQTGEATKQIRALIRDIQTATDNTITLTESGTHSAREGMYLAGEAINSLEKIIRSISITADKAKEIGTSTEHQSRTVDQIAGMIQGLNRRVGQVAGSTQQVAMTAVQLRELADKLVNLILVE